MSPSRWTAEDYVPLQKIPIPWTNIHENITAHVQHLRQLRLGGELTHDIQVQWENDHIALVDGHGTRSLYTGYENRPACRCVMCCYSQSLYSAHRKRQGKRSDAASSRRYRDKAKREREDFVQSILEDAL